MLWCCSCAHHSDIDELEIHIPDQTRSMSDRINTRFIKRFFFFSSKTGIECMFSDWNWFYGEYVATKMTTWDTCKCQSSETPCANSTAKSKPNGNRVKWHEYVRLIGFSHRFDMWNWISQWIRYSYSIIWVFNIIFGGDNIVDRCQW